VSRRARHFTLAVVAVIASSLVVACSSNGGSSSTAAGSATNSSQSSASAASNLTKVWAPGVPTLEQLYHGTYAAPDPKSPPPAKNESIWWISCGQAVVTCADEAAAAQQAAKALGWSFHLYDGNLGTAGAYSTGIQTAIAAKASAIVEQGFACPFVEQALEQAKSAGIPVLGSGALDCSDSGGPQLFTVPNQYGTIVQTQQDYWKLAGKASADYVIDATEGKAQVIDNAGDGQTQQVMLNDAFTTELKKCSGCSVVDTVPFTNSSLTANGPWINAFRTSLLKYPNANAVYIPFDELTTTLGGAQAVRAAGRTVCTSVPSSGGCVVGVEDEGSSAGLDLDRQGQWTADTAAQSFPWLGWAAIDELNRYFNHEPAASEGWGFEAVDKQNGLPATPGTNFTPPINYSADYLKAWGAS
jgi:ribose transport system substrate-binding protein